MITIKKPVGIVGAGTMGRDIASLFLQREESVVLVDKDEKSLKIARNHISSQLHYLAKHEMYDRAEIDNTMEKLITTTDLSTLAEAKIVIEAVPENFDLKCKVFEDIENACSEDTILATNTSGISINKISRTLENPNRMIGIHFFMPATIIPLVEVIRNNDTDDVVVDNIKKYLKDLNKKPVLIRKDVPGFVANRLQHTIMREAMALLEDEVVSVEDLDEIVRYSLGLRFVFTGPFEQRDLNGLDVHYDISSYLYKDLEDSKTPSPVLSEKVEKGELGLKTGQGFYDWEGKSKEEIYTSKNEELLKLVNWLNK